MKRLLCVVLAMIAASAALAATPPKRAAVDTTEAWASGLAYTYDPSGNIRTIGAHSYYYDTAGRLVYGTADSASNAQQFEYDAFGNRTSAARTENAQNCFGGLDCEQSPAVDPQTNHLIAAGVIAYDAAGNLTQANTNYQYAFDAVGAMTSSTKPAAQYIYTAGDERIAVYSGEWRWTVRDLGAHVLREYTSQGTGGQSQWTWSRDHIYRGALPLASVTAAGTLHLHLDHLGTPRLITDTSGTLVAEHAYYAFGTELSMPLSESPREKLHFTGHERDEAADVLQLDYMHARYYSAALGRFVSVDPVIGKPTVPQSWNRYAYVTNNPIAKTDPDGRCGVPTGLQPGQVGLCIASFIGDHFFGAYGLLGRGDGRTFNPNGGTSRIESRLIVDPIKHTLSLANQTINRSGIYIKDFGPQGQGGTSVSNARLDSSGTMHFGVSQDAHSSYAAGGLLFGSIDNHLKFSVTSDGKVGLESGLARDYPSLEVYKYSMSSDGTITAASIVQKSESGDLEDLKRPERPLPKVEPQ
jgi:RHS repeat-associated protein